MGQKLDYLGKFDPSWATKAWGAVRAFFGVGGYAVNSSGLKMANEAVLFVAFNHAWTMASISLAIGITAGLIAILRMFIELARGLWAAGAAATGAVSRWRQGRKPPPEGLGIIKGAFS